MRAMILGAMIAGAVIGTAQAQDGSRGRLFVSPMGEPFRGSADGKPPQDAWFDGADANHDGALSVEEMTADAERFFATLDVRKDGEIDPDDVERYETDILPEIRGGSPTRPRPGMLDGSGLGPKADEGFGSPRARKDRNTKQGAARFSYLDYPQPIVVADRNFNRGVDIREFATAAETRFAALDRNGDGRIGKAELPKLPPPPR